MEVAMTKFAVQALRFRSYTGVGVGFAISKNEGQWKVPTLRMLNLVVVSCWLKVSKFGCRKAESRPEVVTILFNSIQFSLDYISVQCILCFQLSLHCHLLVHSAIFFGFTKHGRRLWAGPTPLSCSEGVLRLGLVRAVLVEGRARMCDKRIERSVCLSLTAETSQPIFFKISLKLARGFLCATLGWTRNGQHFEGFFMETLSARICLQISWYNYGWQLDAGTLGRNMDPSVPSSSPY